MTKCILLSLAAALAVGCAGSGARIRELKDGGAENCKFLGSFQNTDPTGWSMHDDELGALPYIRKRVAEMGGNAFALTHGVPNAFGPTHQADVYKCP